MEEDSEVAALVHKSFKDSQAASHHTNVNLADNIAGFDEESEVEVPSDTLRSVAQPISYLKNDFSQVEDEEGLLPRRLRFHRQKKPPPVVKQPKTGNINHDREQQQLLEAQATSCHNESSTG